MTTSQINELDTRLGVTKTWARYIKRYLGKLVLVNSLRGVNVGSYRLWTQKVHRYKYPNHLKISRGLDEVRFRIEYTRAMDLDLLNYSAEYGDAKYPILGSQKVFTRAVQKRLQKASGPKFSTSWIAPLGNRLIANTWSVDYLSLDYIYLTLVKSHKQLRRALDSSGPTFFGPVKGTLASYGDFDWLEIGCLKQECLSLLLVDRSKDEPIFFKCFTPVDLAELIKKSLSLNSAIGTVKPTTKWANYIARARQVESPKLSRVGLYRYWGRYKR